MSETVCVYCGRVGSRGFVVSSGNPVLRPGSTTYRCADRAACERRQAASPLPDVPDERPGSYYSGVSR